jgi:hypothetical protein
MTKVRTPAIAAMLNPVIGAVGVIAGARRRAGKGAGASPIR